MDFISENVKIIALALIALFAGIAITIRVRKNQKSKTDNSTNRVRQTGNNVGGDMAGRDINK